jgi:hypothetical protein
MTPMDIQEASPAASFHELATKCRRPGPFPDACVAVLPAGVMKQKHRVSGACDGELRLALQLSSGRRSEDPGKKILPRLAVSERAAIDQAHATSSTSATNVRASSSVMTFPSRAWAIARRSPARSNRSR